MPPRRAGAVTESDRTRRSPVLSATAGLRAVALLCAVAGLSGCDRKDAPPATPAGPTFEGSATCMECHPERHETWLHTSHAYALREATEDVVVAAFDGVPVETATFRVTPYRTAPDRAGDGGYRMRVERKDGAPTKEYRIVRAIGRSMQQAFLSEGDRGEWMLMHLTWNLAKKRWDITHRVLSDISDDLGRYDDFHPENHVFNHGCAHCHATGFDPGWDPVTDGYRTTMLEGSVSCESCHGPGSAHVRRHREDAAQGSPAAPRGPEGPRGAPEAEYASPERLVHPGTDSSPREVLETCGRCHYRHSWRFAIESDPRVPWWDVSNSGNHDDYGFFADGRTSGLNYEGTVQVWSRCFTEGGMSCLTCHDPHGGKRFALRWDRQDDDRQCTQCHPAIGADPKAHTKHEDVRCVDCHMPKLLSGQLRRMRDHSVQSPEPAITERVGERHAPNACAVCHTEQSAAWAREHRERWWGKGDERLLADTETVVSLRASQEGAPTARLLEMALDRGRSVFFRRTAALRLKTRGGEDVRAAFRTLLTDPVVDLRQAAAEALFERPDPAAVPALLGALGDSSRIVRIEAGAALARIGVRGPELRPVHAEAKGMLVRRRVYDDALERLSWLAAADAPLAEFDERHGLLLRRTPFAQSAPGPRIAELRAARARLLLAAERPAEAAQEAEAALATKGAVRTADLLADLGDARAAAGNREGAVGIWRTLAGEFPAGSPGALYGAYRLAQTDRRADAATRAAGEALRDLLDRTGKDDRSLDLWRSRARR